MLILLKSTLWRQSIFEEPHINEVTDSPCGIIIPHPALVVDELFSSDFEMSF